MKYVISLVQPKGSFTGALSVSIASEDQCHADLVAADGKAVGAGFFKLSEDQEAQVFGESMTLNKKACDNDAAVLTLFFAGLFDSQRVILAQLYDT